VLPLSILWKILLVEVVSEQVNNMLQQTFSLWQEFGSAQNLILVSIRLKSCWATRTAHDNRH